MLCFSIVNGSRRPANCPSCFSIPVGSILELLGFSSKSTVVHHSSVQLHHSSVLFCIIRQHSSATLISTAALFFSTVLHHPSVQFCTIRQLLFCTIRLFSSAPFVVQICMHHSLDTILRHLLMLFYNSASSNNFTTDANTHYHYLTASLKS